MTDETLKAMEVYGGSFVKQLAVLYRVADPVNRSLLVHAFGDYFSRYEQMAPHLRRAEARASE